MGVSVFVMSDIERSTQLWSSAPRSMSDALRVHDEVVRAAVAGGRGELVKHTGDGFLARFDGVSDAINSAIVIQRALAPSAEAPIELRVRMAVHAGEAERRDDDWFGTAINRTARVMELGNGGQILASGVIASLLEHAPIPGCTLLDLGIHSLRDFPVPEHVFQVLAPGLSVGVPALRTSGGVPVARVPRRRSSFVGRHEDLRAWGRRWPATGW